MLKRKNAYSKVYAIGKVQKQHSVYGLEDLVQQTFG
jgi:hypothetical protein